MSSVYDFSVRDAKGQEVSLRNYQGKTLLIVNTASKCGFTPQYEGLEALQKEFAGKLQVLAFPCNQFGGQEPGSDEEIQNFCQLNYKTSFPVFGKIDVNGTDADPLFEFLKKERPGIMNTEAIKWNFTKFLIDQNGQPVKRYAPNDTPESIKAQIQQLLAAQAPQTRTHVHGPGCSHHHH